ADHRHRGRRLHARHRRDVSGAPALTRHLGIDLGATNLKWSVLEQDRAGWRSLDRGQEPPLAAEGPDAVVGRLTAIAGRARDAWPDLWSIAIGVDGLYHPDARAHI